jgi:hypothetical protein
MQDLQIQFRQCCAQVCEQFLQNDVSTLMQAGLTFLDQRCSLVVRFFALQCFERAIRTAHESHNTPQLLAVRDQIVDVLFNVCTIPALLFSFSSLHQAFTFDDFELILVDFWQLNFMMQPTRAEIGCARSKSASGKGSRAHCVPWRAMLAAALA